MKYSKNLLEKITWNHFKVDEGDDEDDELFFVVWLTSERRLALFPAGTLVRDPHHPESLTHLEQYQREMTNETTNQSFR